MLGSLKSKLNIKILLLCLFLLIMGLSAGIFLGEMIPSSEKQHLVTLIQNSSVQTIPTILLNLGILLLICLACYTIYGFPVAIVILIFRSFAVGLCDCLLLYSINANEIINFIFSFFFPQLLLCTIHLYITATCVSWAISQLQHRR